MVHMDDPWEALFCMLDIQCKETRVAATVEALRHCWARSNDDLHLSQHAGSLLEALDAKAAALQAAACTMDNVVFSAARTVPDGRHTLRQCATVYWESVTDVDEWLEFQKVVDAIYAFL